jgi:hypothetical protein
VRLSVRDRLGLPRLRPAERWTLSIRKSRPFSVEEFDRRREQELDGVSVFVAAAEDVIIAKLEWAKLGESERQLRDAAGIVMSRADELDVNYIEKWTKQLALSEYWKRVKDVTV